MKVTPAMKRWAREIAAGRVVVERSRFAGARAIRGGSGFTYVMGSKMEDAGLIVWEPPNKVIPGTVSFECPSIDHPQTAVLTDAGRSCFS